MRAGKRGGVFCMSFRFRNEEFATMRTIVRTMVGMGLVALLASPALAQQGRGGGMMGGGGLSGLIGNASVQKELKLDDTQAEKAKDFAAKAREKMTENRSKLEGLEGEERRTKQQEINKEMNEAALKAFGEFLKPEQVARLKQINNQVRGAQAFSDPEIAAKLNLTDSQKTEIQAISQESFGKFATIRTDHEGDREGMMKAFTELRKETLTKAEAKLNDEQQKTWKELLGAPFEYKADPPRNN